MNYKTYEETLEIFKKVNCAGDENIIFVTHKDSNKEAAQYVVFGAVGEAVAAFSQGILDGIEGYDGLLINATDKGLGIIPLRAKGIQLLINISNMEPQLDSYFFIPYEKVEDITIKNFNIFNKKIQKLDIKIKDSKTIHQLVKVSDKEVLYQENNFARFMNKYKDGYHMPANINNNEIKEEDLINNNEEKEKFASWALNILMTNKLIEDYNNIECEYGYLYNIPNHGYEGLFKIKKLDKIYYFSVQGEELKMINLDEDHFIAYRDSFIEMHKNK